MDGAVSEWKPMLASIPQGSMISPMLYNSYTSEIPKSVRSELAVHADDICVYDQHKSVGFAHLLYNDTSTRSVGGQQNGE